ICRAIPVRCGSCNRCEKRGHTRRRQNSCFSIATQSLATMWCPLSGSSEASRCVPRIAARGRTASRSVGLETRMVKKLEGLEIAHLRTSLLLLNLSSPTLERRLQSLFQESVNTGVQDGLGADAGLHHGIGQSGALVAERISGRRESYPESPDQRSA